jgi:hypothetical protein
MFNGVLWNAISLSGRYCNDSDKISVTVHNETNSISKNDKRLILPFCKCDFSKVTLNPKFVAKYYDLQDRKRSFTESITFTFLKEYFYFKSFKSFYLVKREQNRKVC